MGRIQISYMSKNIENKEEKNEERNENEWKLLNIIIFIDKYFNNINEKMCLLLHIISNCYFFLIFLFYLFYLFF